MRRLLDERNFPVDEIRYFASSRSAGTTLPWKGTDIVVEDTETADVSGLDIALFSAGATGSRAYAAKFVAGGAVVIDNSSAWRMDPDVPLIVSEVNGHLIGETPKGIIANPNCTTMAAMPVLKPLHDEAGLTRLIASTYQAVSGGGLAGVDELDKQARQVVDRAAELTHDGAAVDVPDAREVRASRSPSTCCRWPARSSTTASSRPTRRRSSATRAARSSTSPTCSCRARACGCRCSPVTRCRSTPSSPTRSRSRAPTRCCGRRPVSWSATSRHRSRPPARTRAYVGRIRRDHGAPDGRGLALFVSNDNLRKGAALNTIQIAELFLA